MVNEYRAAHKESSISNENSVIVDESSVVVPQDIRLIKSVENLDRERIPERVVHASGAGRQTVSLNTTTVNHKTLLERC